MTSMKPSANGRKSSKGAQQTDSVPNGERRPRLSSRHPSIDPERLVRMDRVRHVVGRPNDFNVVFVGAGNMMFGSDEGPWNHSFRFEHKLGPRLKVIAVIDPSVERAQAALQQKCDSFVVSAYQDTRIYRSFDEYVTSDADNGVPKPHAFLIGSPPMFRGSTVPGRDVEMQILKHFPGVPFFVEKPVATGPETELQDLLSVSKEIKESNAVCSVGYMLRYLKAVQMMKQIIEENNLTVMATIARYACAYEKIAKPDWWDKARSFGPIIEQATHFCDLSRYFGGEVDVSTVQAHSLEWDEEAGYLSKLPIDESEIPPEQRIPRVTSANWKYECGAVGTLIHLVSLQGSNYSCELQVFADGYSFKLENPYQQPVLYVRRPGDDYEETYRFPDDDPFFSEVSNWIDVIEDIEEDPESGKILSPFDDAVKTYEFTWAIRRASEMDRKTKEGRTKTVKPHLPN
ncbi:hypothetical protein SCHPADRAFT_917149 [Schizopora paradoxa]|uniref:NAD(P)-binding protein n=1 Tax=Schizopora paradoxa TaxID=27342 RepID=A0A0H2RDM7_9AGAM|nr:hypothetical protein SCHPADRAFT_917149 [Schizopora paradoxa]